MRNETTTAKEVVEATPEDITCILAWLKREYDEDGDGFWCNANLISDAGKRPGDIWVVRRNGEAVAFQLGRYSASILSVRKDYRKMGVGTSLVEASVERAFSDDVNALSVQCQPEESFGFWERMGFVRYSDLEPISSDVLVVYRIVPRTFKLPFAASSIEVVIGFYPESAQYGDAKDVVPIAEHHVAGVYADDGSIILNQRVIGLSHYGRGGDGDTVVKVEIDGVSRCFCKAKHESARAVGVRHDSIGSAYFIDRVAPSGH
jgi:GNAT superfamily N-acetyltransferase